jgi:hypothetical protein
VVFRSQVPAVWGGFLLAWLLLMVELRLVQPDDHRLLRDSALRHPGREDMRLVRADAGIALWHRLSERVLARQAQAGREGGAPAMGAASAELTGSTGAAGWGTDPAPGHVPLRGA